MNQRPVVKSSAEKVNIVNAKLHNTSHHNTSNWATPNRPSIRLWISGLDTLCLMLGFADMAQKEQGRKRDISYIGYVLWLYRQVYMIEPI